MKLQRPVAARIATKDAFAPCLFYQDALQKMTSSHRGLNPTAFAPVGATTLENKRGPSMSAAAQRGLAPSVPRTVVSTRRCLELMFSHPVPNSCQASIRLPRDFTQ